jgi:hypothetical protein
MEGKREMSSIVVRQTAEWRVQGHKDGQNRTRWGRAGRRELEKSGTSLNV